MGSQPRRQLIDDAFEEARRGVHELVDGRADHHHDDAGPLEDLGLVAQLEASGRQDFDQELVGASLAKGHLPLLDADDLVEVGVVDADAGADIRE